MTSGSWEREHLGDKLKSQQWASRRGFLKNSCRFAAATFLPSNGLLQRLNLLVRAAPQVRPSPPPSEYRLTPHYRLESRLQDILRSVHPGFDTFTMEKYAEEIRAVLERWSADLRAPAPGIRAILDSLAAGIRASTLRPSEHEPLRLLSGLEVYRNRFSRQPLGDSSAFAEEFRSFISPFARLETAEFKVTAISAASGGPAGGQAVHTRLRYDLVGTGQGFFRGERVGHWSLDWESSVPGEWKVSKWQALDETESRAAGPVFVDVTESAFGANASYREQLLKGTDHWRSVFDAASRIDVYGHNGVAGGDFDGDGFDDIYVCQPSGLPNRLYRNRGDGTFEDATEAAGVGVLDNTACALFADFTNNGRQDLIVVTVDGPLLFLNQGQGRFGFRPDAFRFARPPQGSFTGAAAADYDRDGRLDVYFCLYSYYQGLNQYQSPTPYYDARNGPPNFLMRNNGDGTFTDATERAGMNQNNDRFSFTCGWTDYNGDGWPDLYVVNDFGRKNLYLNSGHATFTDVAADAGVDDVGAGMSVCWFDYDNDGSPDLYVADMWSAAGERVTDEDEFMKGAPEAVRSLLRKHARGNSLFHNTGNGRFADTSAAAGVEMGRWAWSSDAWDFDHDGFPDLYVTNGMISGPDAYDLSSFFWRQVVPATPLQPGSSRAYGRAWNAINELVRSDGTWAGYERNVFLANNRDGTFSDISGTTGLDSLEDSRAFALADFDHDGRLEVLLKNRSAPQVRLLRNAMPELGASVAVRLQGTDGNRDAIGARVTVEAGALRQTRFLQAGSGFLSEHTKDLLFGLGNEKGPVRLVVRWPSGAVQRFDSVPVGHRIELEEGAGQFHAEPFRPSAAARGAGPAVSPSTDATIETWLLVPVAAPDFSLPDLSGQTRALESFRGQVLLLNFWATWAPPSREQLRAFSRRENLNDGLKVLALSVDDPGDGDKVRAVARDERLTLPIVIASSDTIAVYNILYRYLFDRRRDLGLPTSFLLDSRGFIVKVYQGVVEPARIERDAREIPETSRERLTRAFPFRGDWYGGEFHRNELTYAAVFLERGYNEAAAAACRLVLEDEPQSAEARYLLGSVDLRENRRNEAQGNFEQALKLRPAYPDTWPDAWNNLGMLAVQDSRTDEAITDFDEALRLNPQYVIALENLGNSYRQQHRWAEAQSTLERAVALDPEDPDANYSLAMVFAARDDTERAYEYLTRALRLRPNYPQALNNLGILYARTNRLAEAMATFQKCVEVAPDFEEGYLNLARGYVAEGEKEKARGTLQQFLRHHPDSKAVAQVLAELTP